MAYSRLGITRVSRPSARESKILLSPVSPESTKWAKDNEGWVRTGDVAALDERGRFRITDRVKNIMKLSRGEYVALGRIENVLSAAPIIAQIFVYGHSLQSYLLAVVVPDPINLARIASPILGKEIAGIDTAVLDEAVKGERVVKAILDLTKESTSDLLPRRRRVSSATKQPQWQQASPAPSA